LGFYGLSDKDMIYNTNKKEWYVIKHRSGFYIVTRVPDLHSDIITTKPLTRMDARKFISILLKLKVYK